MMKGGGEGGAVEGTSGHTRDTAGMDPQGSLTRVCAMNPYATVNSAEDARGH